MAYEMKENSGSLFKNDRREKDTQPNATGSCLIDGVEYFVSAWTKDGTKGKWQSLSFKRKDDKKPSAPNKNSYQAPTDIDETLPF